MSRKYLAIIVGVALFTCSTSLKVINEIKLNKPAQVLSVSDISDYFPSITPTPSNTPIPTPVPTTTPSPYPTSTPQPTQTPTPPTNAIAVNGSQLDIWFDKYSSEYGIDKEKLKRTAVCESNLNTDAVNGLYGGLYQFSPSAWKSTRSQMNMNTDPELRFNAEEAIKTAAFKISVNGLSAWPNCIN